jgi:hypothetical protein
VGVCLGDQVTDEAQIELCLQVPIEVIRGNQRFERDEDRSIQRSLLRGAKHQEEHPWANRERSVQPRQSRLSTPIETVADVSIPAVLV